MIEVGAVAPDFTLPSNQGEVSLASYRDRKNVVLMFYPADDTGG